MKYIHHYDTEQDFQNTYYGEDYNEPWVSLTETAEPHVDYNKGYIGVDLGLPSGTRWAEYNIGAEDPSEVGNYYAWAETAPKSNYVLSTYKYWDASRGYTKYVYDDHVTRLMPEDDAAQVNLGGNWHVPTYNDFVELLENCTVEVLHEPNTGVKYFEFTSEINGNTILFYDYREMCGEERGTGSNLILWSSEIAGDYCYPGQPFVLYGSAEYGNTPTLDEAENRYYGLPIRPVFKLPTPS